MFVSYETPCFLLPECTTGSGLEEGLFSQMIVSHSECGMLMQVCVRVCVCQWVNGMFTSDDIHISLHFVDMIIKYTCSFTYSCLTHLHLFTWIVVS